MKLRDLFRRHKGQAPVAPDTRCNCISDAPCVALFDGDPWYSQPISPFVDAQFGTPIRGVLTNERPVEFPFVRAGSHATHVAVCWEGVMVSVGRLDRPRHLDAMPRFAPGNLTVSFSRRADDALRRLFGEDAAP